MSDEELKKRAAARARAIMARKKREAADFDEEVAGERSKAGNVTGQSQMETFSGRVLRRYLLSHSLYSSLGLPESSGRWCWRHGDTAGYAPGTAQRLPNARSLLASSSLRVWYQRHLGR
jgi:hypothetical protein